MQVENPFEEEVAPNRRLETTRVSKHRAGRQPKMGDATRRRRIRARRERIAAYLDQKAVENG